VSQRREPGDPDRAQQWQASHGDGGISGQRSAPTVQQLQTPKQQGKLRYVLIGGGGGNDSNAQSINSWVVAHGKVINYGGGSSGLTLYDLSGAVS